MSLYHPFQKLCVVSTDGHQQLLLAASGSTINSISLAEGELLHQWPSRIEEIEDNSNETGHRPSKRRKLESNEPASLSRQQSEASDVSLETVSERKKGERKKSKIIDTKAPNVSHLLASTDRKSIIAVTAEDKAIRVFTISSTGRLSQISQRSLPKKLCAVRLTKDEKIILAADKFGDVYALPLHQSKDWTPKEKVQVETSFKPSATELTVHTKGNLEALKQQQGLKTQKPRKEGPDFDHQLVLGHVSLLTDLAVAEGIVGDKLRPFILTADRDEHIRVSRGIPQAHIIENFCLGHEEFVSRLCIPAKRPDLLIVGNGEPSLRLFDWQKGELKQRIPLRLRDTEHSEVKPEQDMEEANKLPEGRTQDKLAVSGIWPVTFFNSNNDGDSLLLVAIEGIPIILNVALGADGLRILDTDIKLHGNVVDIVLLESTRQILVSIDNVHKPFSMKAYRNEDELQDVLLQTFELEDPVDQMTDGGDYQWKEVKSTLNDIDLLQILPTIPGVTTDDNTRNSRFEKVFSELGEFLYGLENLRKKRYFTAEEEAEMEVEDDKLEEQNVET